MVAKMCLGEKPLHQKNASCEACQEPLAQIPHHWCWQSVQQGSLHLVAAGVVQWQHSGRHQGAERSSDVKDLNLTNRLCDRILRGQLKIELHSYRSDGGIQFPFISQADCISKLSLM